MARFPFGIPNGWFLLAYSEDLHAVVATQDFPIWEHKRFRAQPALAEGDGPIAEFRRWAAQFYT